MIDRKGSTKCGSKTIYRNPDWNSVEPEGEFYCPHCGWLSPSGFRQWNTDKFIKEVEART